MAIVQKVPRKLEEVLGPDGTDQFVDFLNVSFNTQKEDVVELVADKFERKLVEEISKAKIDIANVKGSLETQIANLDSKISKEIATQTRWILTAILGGATLISFFSFLGNFVKH
ncbi:MAG: hypothetical protein K8R21_05990 [Leptospira sp.]|nr:hypothetical protein [Leptospira sp.]